MHHSFNTVLTKYRQISFSEKDKGERFERLMKAYLLTEPKYVYTFSTVWLWTEFPYKQDLGGADTGIDLIALTKEGEYWAIQCKCYQEGSVIDKPAIDSFLATSSRAFFVNGHSTLFSYRLWIDTTGQAFGTNAEKAITHQNPPVGRIGLQDLLQASVDWTKLDEGEQGQHAQVPKKQAREHQKIATEKTLAHFKQHERGKLIMACGTGKTFTSLHIAQAQTNGKGFILFLVPSIALLGQTLNEWAAQARSPMHAICICSDPEISKKRNNDDNTFQSISDLAFPASTDVPTILQRFEQLNQLAQNTAQDTGLTVVFSTYQSIDVIAKAQAVLSKKLPQYADFDLIICDEAHRTTGVTLSDKNESAFVKVHDRDFISAKKRLYMTATPRLYDEAAQSKAAQNQAFLCSMDDEHIYGQQIYHIGFGEAVEKGLLTDYKVLILTVNENDISPAVQKIVSDSNNELNASDAAKIIGCINALSKQIVGDEGLIRQLDPNIMKRAVAFCPKIEESKKITAIFNSITTTYLSEINPTIACENSIKINAEHIDGSMNAAQRNHLMAWLQSQAGEDECRILTNVRCLSEGVDVPSLDAVMFLSPRNSQVDVVQSVGRVMRRAEGKQFGYIIIPVVIPSNVSPEKAMEDNDKFRVVWQVLNALRAHDDRFEATINKIDLNRKKPDNILLAKAAATFDEEGNCIRVDNETDASKQIIAEQLSLQFQALQGVLFARLVDKVGDKRYWEQWAKSVGDIATRQIERITKIVNENPKYQKSFDSFLKGLHTNINPSITQTEAIEMLSQHIITKPVFDALFEDYSFVKNNPMSQSMQKMLDVLEEESLETDAETLDKFYQSVKTRAAGIDNAEGKQRIIIELYDKFFKTAFPKMVEKLGIVYSPVEVVDFIIHSVADILQQEFGRSISDENVHVLDPFTGTGTFITRLLHSGLINSTDLTRKYTSEIHCNEIVLLAYYIAAVNIENAFHDLQPKSNTNYIPFEGICLTDTFQLAETTGEQLFSEMFPQNSERVQRQQKLPLQIIFGNPPYSIGQKSANDNAQNQSYPKLDQRIADTYAKQSSAGLNKSLYDAYIKAFRWSADRLDKTGGIIAFVSNGAWLDGNSTDGFRKSIEKEFTSIYVFNLRGNQRTSGELSRKEGGKIFGSGSRTPIAITVLVKNPDVKTDKATIHYHDIGEYLNREEKLKLISDFKSFANPELPLKAIQPNKEGDWLSMRNEGFENYIPLAPDKKFDLKGQSFFNQYSNGIATGKDAWVYNSSYENVVNNLNSMIDFYNQQRQSFIEAKKQNPKLEIEKFVKYDSTKISWSDIFLRDANKNIPYKLDETKMAIGLYRPFFKQRMSYDKIVIHRTYQLPKLFPKTNSENLVIIVTGTGAGKPFCSLITNNIPNYHTLDTDQCFPLYYYEENTATQTGMFDEDNKNDYIRRDAISDFILERAIKIYGKNVSKEDIFYYVYGFLHSPIYRETFANDLKKMLPRLPLLEDIKDFWAFSQAGRKLAELHLNYETVAPFADATVTGDKFPSDAATITDDKFPSFGGVPEGRGGLYTVEKMRFPKKNQKDTIIYNSKITVSNIPAQAYEYVVNGKSAIEWIMERYQVTTHKESGITNNPNDWAIEVGNPRYILDLLLSVINVSVQTVDIVNTLPTVQFE
jgi:predicted helicase